VLHQFHGDRSIEPNRRKNGHSASPLQLGNGYRTLGIAVLIFPDLWSINDFALFDGGLLNTMPTMPLLFPHFLPVAMPKLLFPHRNGHKKPLSKTRDYYGIALFKIKLIRRGFAKNYLLVSQNNLWQSIFFFNQKSTPPAGPLSAAL